MADLDPGALAAVRDLYDDLQVDGRVLDLGGAAAEQFNYPPDERVEHAPDDVLPFADESFDDVVSFHAIRSMKDPAATFAEVARVLRPGGRFICTFTGRPEPESADAAWAASDDARRVRLVRDHFARTAGFGPAESDLRTSLTGEGDRLWAVWAVRRDA